MKLRSLVTISVLSALAFVLMLFEFPIPALFPVFLKYDFSELPAILAAVGLGPGHGAAVVLVKNLLFLISGRGEAGWIGVLANLLAGIPLVVVTGWVAALLRLDRWDRAVPQAAVSWWSRGTVAILAGTLAMSAVMLVANGAFILHLWGIPADQTWNTALVAITPFNLFKGVLSGTLGLVLSRRVVPSVVQTLSRAA